MRFNRIAFVFVLLALTSAVAWAEDPLAARPPKPEMKTAAANATASEEFDTTIAESLEPPNPEEKKQLKQELLADNKTGIYQKPDTLSILSDLRTTQEIRKVQVEIAKMDKQLRDLRNPTKIAHFSQLVPPQAKPRIKSKPVRPKVVAVQGVGEKLHAVLRTRTGLITVRTGDRIGTGKVVRIEPDRVMVRYGKSETSLSFVE